MRLFIAINFPDEIRTTISKFRDSLKDMALRGNFTLDENLHLTLVFLGECDIMQVNNVKTVMDNAPFSAFTLLLDKIGHFKRYGGDTWWIGLKENQMLMDLQAYLSGRLIQQGFALENRKYAPHVTIGREVNFRSGIIIPIIPQVSFHVASIELMKSEHINKKLTYTTVFSKNLNK